MFGYDGPSKSIGEGMRQFLMIFCWLGVASLAEAQTTNFLPEAVENHHSSASLLPHLAQPKQLSDASYWYGSASVFGVVSGVTGMLYLSTLLELKELSSEANKIPDEILYAQTSELKSKSRRLALVSGLSLGFAVGGALGGAFWTNHQTKLVVTPSLQKTSLRLKFTF
jgi:hypothetical protein